MNGRTILMFLGIGTFVAGMTYSNIPGTKIAALPRQIETLRPTLLHLPLVPALPHVPRPYVPVKETSGKIAWIDPAEKVMLLRTPGPAGTLLQTFMVNPNTMIRQNGKRGRLVDLGVGDMAEIQYTSGNGKKFARSISAQ